MSVPTYKIAEDGGSITCLLCGLTSYNLNDVEKKYCGRCGWHDDPNEPGVAAFKDYMRARMNDLTLSVPMWKRLKEEGVNLTQNKDKRKCRPS